MGASDEWLDFRYVGPFEIRAHQRLKIDTLWPPVKVRGGLAKCLSEFYEIDPRSNIWHTFGGASVGRLGD